jgi:hypothetical protein
MMKRHLLLIPGLALCAICTAPAQNVISARSGLVHYVEGRVYVNDKAVETSVTNFPEVKENQVLRTEEGRAEVLLGPGVFLRIAENSSFRMITNRLIDTRIEHLTGSVLIECVDLPKGNNLTVVSRETTVSLLTKGLYRFDSHPAQFRVFEGQALAESGGRKVELRKGKMVSLEGNLVAGKFDSKVTDDFFLWSQRRSQYIAMANVSAANSLQGSSLYASAWQWNPYFGMFTFIPFGGTFYSPFGYPYWSPGTVQGAGAYPVGRPAPVTSPVPPTKRPPKRPAPSPTRPLPAISGGGHSRSGSGWSGGGGGGRSGGGGGGRSGGGGGGRSGGGGGGRSGGGGGHR